MEHSLTNREVYLERMSKPLKEKLRVARYIDGSAKNILDVGCADGTVTLALAHLYPDKQFLGIDLDKEFVLLATKKAQEEGLTNVRFENIYLRELLARPERFDSVLFISVLHEFYSYGEGISSVLKAVADAEEILQSGGDVIIRDMVLLEYAKRTSYLVPTLVEKISSNSDIKSQIKDFEKYFGKLESIYAVNHFLLKYMYKENWEREAAEHYVPVTFEQYETIFSLLGMELVLRDSHLLEYLKGKWVEDFSLTQDELAPLISTGFLVARKGDK
jgi:2-polyprenyl-3-methyl-5-hydroxy-6-metoxy-1,4-benzoquinol methylase